MKKFMIFIGLIITLFISAITFAGDANLSWDPNPPGDNVVGYTVYWYESAVPDTVYNKTVTTNTASIEESLFKFDTEYTFYVTAYNEAGESEHSDTVSGTIRTSYTPLPDNIPDEIVINKPSKVTITISIE